MVSPSDEPRYVGPWLTYTEDAIVVCGADRSVMVWNEGARRMFGWTAQEVVGQPATALGLIENDGERMERRRYLAEHGHWRGELAVQRKDGTEVPVDGSVIAIREAEGRISGYLGILRDITERRSAEEALNAANRRADAILERMCEAFFGVDDRWRYTDVNDRAVAQAGKAWGREASAEELLGRNCWDLFPETVGTAFDRELHHAVREQHMVEFETYWAPANAWLEVRAYPSSDGLSVYSRDVTARRRGRNALAYQESMLDNIEDAVIATSADEFRITAWNKGAERLYGLTADEVLGLPAREVGSFPGDVSRLTLERELLEAGRARIEFTARRPDGTPVQVDLVAVAVKDSRGETIAYLGIHRDVTERKQAKEQQASRLRQQAAVAELGLRALANGGLRRLMDEATTLVCRTLGVDYAKVDELLPGGRQLLVRAGAGLRDGIVGSVTMPTGRGSPAGYALMIGQPVIVEDMAAETRFRVPAPLREHEVMSDITVLIGPLGNPFGALAAMSRKRRSFSEDDVGFVQAVANVLATAVERAQAEEQLESVREAERGRIARALHDEALQGLSAAIALALVADRPPAESRLAGQLLPVLRRVGEQLRFAIYDLRMESEAHAPFVELVEQLVDEHRAAAGDCDIELDLGEGVPSRSLGVRGTEVLRILGEALTNARGHAEARRVRVRVWSANGRLWVEVSDDGRGFDTASPVSGIHRGITGMRERTELVGGRLEIHSEPGVGTTVRLELPLSEGASGDT